ncbi:MULTISPECIES: DUF7521 family protein [Salinibaculum]|uniref:DUF7521 family protein n=1 Tax=Salinibaculum TaxID=2732368 RepID=UPI0030D3E90A
MLPLQLSPPDVPSWARLVSQSINLVTALVGLLIAYQAYRGYRRNQSRPMFYIAVGFILTVGLPFVLLVPTLLLADVEPLLVGLIFVRDIATLVGLAAILYALRMPVGGG